MGPIRFDDQGFVVMGGAHGVGRFVVRLAAQRGATVLFSGQSGGELATSDLIALAQFDAPGRVICVPVDPSVPSDLDRFFDAAFERLPGIHVAVIDQAGFPDPFAGKPLHETSLADWEESLSLNLRNPFLFVQRALEEFLAAGEGGRIVWITRAVPAGAPANVAFVAAQSALASFVRSITKEYGRRRIACNAVVVDEDLEAQLGEPLLQNGKVSLPVEAAAETVLFLASSEASFVNGEFLHVPPALA
jgi:3-oxoacyl-[acyl-carrier protein] reductase